MVGWKGSHFGKKHIANSIEFGRASMFVECKILILHMFLDLQQLVDEFSLCQQFLRCLYQENQFLAGSEQ